MGHDHSSPAIEGQGHTSRSKVKLQSLGPRVRAVLVNDNFVKIGLADVENTFTVLNVILYAYVIKMFHTTFKVLLTYL